MQSVCIEHMQIQRQLAKMGKVLSYIITPQWLIMSAFSLCRCLDLAVTCPGWRGAILLGFSGGTGSRGGCSLFSSQHVPFSPPLGPGFKRGVQTITGSLVQNSHNDLMYQTVACSDDSFNYLMFQIVACSAGSYNDHRYLTVACFAGS